MYLKRKDGSIDSDGINNKTYEILFNDVDNLSNLECGSDAKAKAFGTIEMFTLVDGKESLLTIEILNEKLKEIFDYDLDRISYNVETNKYEYREGSLLFEFEKWSDYVYTNFMYEKLTSEDRYKKCHSASLEYARYLSLNGKEAFVVTGYVIVGAKKTLHSVVEIETVDNDVLILDFTKNLIMNKDQYMELTNFRELNSISANFVNGDKDLFFDKLDANIKAYVLFRDEFMRDILRNFGIFKKKVRNRNK